MHTTLNPTSNHTNIVFFDGLCGLCNKTVDFLIRIDRKDKLVFAPLQGETAKKHLSESQIKDPDTIVFSQNGRLLIKSTAVIRILIEVGGMWSLFSIFRIFPKFVRDGLYDFVARSRFRWFGKRETCRKPTENERNKLLP
ncbi:MAG TPA: thiol-disulfide oxidoreductase [Flavobacteriales bacterium]|nr:thiol-disulfide oxidoreductase [Flavobacteriales bacterium]